MSLNVLFITTSYGHTISNIKLAASFLEGYFQNDPRISFDHYDISVTDGDRNAVWEKMSSPEYDVIGLSACAERDIYDGDTTRGLGLSPNWIVELLKKRADKVVVGGPIVNTNKEFLLSQGFKICDTFGEWYFEELLGSPRTENIIEHQRIKLTDTTLNRLRSCKADWMVYFPFGFGCYWNKCSFCNFKSHNFAWNFKNSYAFRSQQSLSRLLADINDSFPLQDLTLFNTMDAAAAKDLHQIAELVDGKAKWAGYFRADKYPQGYGDNFFMRMKAKGLTRINIGVECAHDEGLKLLNKGTTLASIAQAVKDASEAGVTVEAGYITHIPGFTHIEESIENLHRLIVPYISSISFYRLHCIKGSIWYDEFKEHNKDNTPTYTVNLGDELERKNEVLFKELQTIADSLDPRTKYKPLVYEVKKC